MGRNRDDRHHMLFERATWSTRHESKLLRDTPTLIPLIHRRLHEEIHQAVPPVPLLGSQALFQTVRLFEPEPTMAGSVDALSTAMDRATKQSHSLERELAGLAIENLQIQKRMILDNTPQSTVIDLRRVA